MKSNSSSVNAALAWRYARRISKADPICAIRRDESLFRVWQYNLAKKRAKRRQFHKLDSSLTGHDFRRSLSTSSRYVGRAIAALAADPYSIRWNGKSVSFGQLATEYGFTDLDGSETGHLAIHRGGREAGLEGDYDKYR